MTIYTNDGKLQVKKEIGEDTGFIDNDLTPIKVGDYMGINHFCNCEYCQKQFKCRVMWNDEWNAYGLVDDTGKWHSGMGIVGGFHLIKN